MRTVSARRAAVRLAAVCLAAAACGQKGPPQAPLHLVPAAVTEISVRRLGDHARLRFALPSRNANGPGRLELDRVEIYAMTIASGTAPPPNRDLLTKAYLVGEIAVRPEPIEGQPPAEEDARPAAGSTVTFDDELTAAKLAPVPVKTQGSGIGAQGSAAAPPSAQPGGDPQKTSPAAAATLKHPVRVYVTRGVTRTGRPGPPSTRVQLPIVPVPPPPADVAARFTESAIVLEWKSPDTAVVAYNVYPADDPMRPITPAPVTATTLEHTFAKFGEQRCFRVRSIAVVGDVGIESDLSPEQCVTPRDTFPPAPPKGLAAVPTPGQISLIWDPNTEKDLAGYIVLRGDAPDGALAPLTPSPIKDTSYRDTTVKPGASYIYAVVAVDTATPPNTSAQSARREETAR
jgi:predicted small lipoprotein YifL